MSSSISKHDPRFRGPIGPRTAMASSLFASLMLLGVCAPAAGQSSGGAVARPPGAKPPLAQVQTPPAGRATGEPEPEPEPVPPPLRPSRCRVDADSFRAPHCGVDDPCGLGAPFSCRSASGGIDVAAAGVGLRHTPGGTLSMRGIPTEAQPLWGILLFTLITEDPEGDGPQRIRFEGTDLEGRLVTTAPEPCWTGDDVAKTATFAVDVTALLGERLNGDFQVGKDDGARRDWSDPWDEPLGSRPLLSQGPELEGAALLIFYDDPARAAESTVHVWLGEDRIDDSVLFELAFAPPLGPTAHAELLQILADGQRRRQDGPVMRWATVLGTSETAFTVAQGPLSPADVRGTGSGDEGGPVTQLWDIERTAIDVVAAKLHLGADSFLLAYLALGGEVPVAETVLYDCFNPVLLALAAEPPAN